MTPIAPSATIPPARPATGAGTASEEPEGISGTATGGASEGVDDGAGLGDDDGGTTGRVTLGAAATGAFEGVTTGRGFTTTGFLVADVRGVGWTTTGGGVREAVGRGLAAAPSAARASTSPEPAPDSGCAVDLMRDSTALRDIDGVLASSRAAIPATCGAACEVPAATAYCAWVERRHADRLGAVVAVRLAAGSCHVDAGAVLRVGRPAGPTARLRRPPGRCRCRSPPAAGSALPAEKTTTIPAPAASRTASGIAVDWETPGTWAPRERLITFAPCDMAQRIPAATSAGRPVQPPLPSSSSTWTGRMVAFWRDAERRRRDRAGDVGAVGAAVALLAGGARPAGAVRALLDPSLEVGVGAVDPAVDDGDGHALAVATGALGVVQRGSGCRARSARSAGPPPAQGQP